MKGRITWVFWLVVVLAVLTTTSSYAWLVMNISADVRGIAVEAVSDSIFLQISACENEEYGKDVSFGRVMYSMGDEQELSLVTCGRLPETGAVRIITTEISASNAHQYSNGRYNGTGQYFKAVKSDIARGNYSYIDVTDTLNDGDSLIGLCVLRETRSYAESDTINYFYYYKSIRKNGVADYVCLGIIPVGQVLKNRLFWGYSYSSVLDDAQTENTLNIVSLDLPEPEYALKNTVYLRCAQNTNDASNLRIDSVEISGIRNYLTNAIRIMFVARANDGTTVTKFYSHRTPSDFDGALFPEIKGNAIETVEVDIYVYFDGTDQSAYKQDKFLTRNDVNVTFSVDDHNYK